MTEDGLPETILMYADSVRSADMFYATHFWAPDPFIYLRHPGGELLVTNSMEANRARRESRVSEVKLLEDFGYGAALAQTGREGPAMRLVLAGVLRSFGLSAVSVPPDFPLPSADALRSDDVAVDVVEDLWTMRRRLKRPDEVAAMREAQRANEGAVSAGVRLIGEAEVRGADLYWKGQPLTAEQVRAAIQVAGIGDGVATPDGCIVAPGLQATDPHEMGRGPLHRGEPIIIDSFPQHSTSRYWADMTRTVVRGAPSKELQNLYDDVLAAQELALAELRPGVDGREVWAKVCEFFKGRGHPTQLEDPTTSEGFIHGLGHGLGLEVHEKPRLNQESVVLQPGDVVTVEPGLYYPKLGAVRIEDVAVITESGFDNLTHFSKAFVLD